MKRAVVTVAAGEIGKALLRFSRSWLERYATRLQADLVVLDWCLNEYPMYSKFQIYRTLEHYDRIIYLDADTLADPDACPDLFARVPAGHFGIYDDAHALRAANKFDIFVNEVTKVRASQGMPASGLPWYGNTGIFVAERMHKDLLAPPARSIPMMHCGEQSLFNARLQDSGVPITFLPDDCNRQWWEHREFKAVQPPNAILHFSGMHEKDNRLGLMKKVAREKGLIPPWEPYIIAAVGRTGSTLLAFALRNAGLGEPYEHLSPHRGTPRTLEFLRSQRCGKVQFAHVAELELKDELLIPDAKYISLTRRDIIRQAVSLSRAGQTEKWTSENAEVRPPVYDRGHIEWAIVEIAKHQAGWEDYYALHGIVPLRIFYEDLAADYRGTVRRVLDYLGEDRPVPPTPSLERLADGLTEEWVARFLEETSSESTGLLEAYRAEATSQCQGSQLLPSPTTPWSS